MTYIKDKPDSGPSPAIDAATIRGNFTDYGNVFDNNHVALNDRNQGAHTQIIYQKQSSDPGVTEDLAVIYAKDATSNASSEPQLFAQIPQFLPNQYDSTPAPNVGMQLTHNTVNTTGPNQFYTFLPGGYLLFTGIVTGNSVPNVLTSLSITLSPSPTKILAAIATPNTLTSVGTPTPFTVSTTIDSQNQFTIYSTANGPSPSIPYQFTYTVMAKA